VLAKLIRVGMATAGVQKNTFQMIVNNFDFTELVAFRPPAALCALLD
jgi:hypothetical protein